MLLGWDYDAKIAIGDILPSKLESVRFTDDLDKLGAFEWTDEGYLQLIKAYFERGGACETQLRCIFLEINSSKKSLAPRHLGAKQSA